MQSARKRTGVALLASLLLLCLVLVSLPDFRLDAANTRFHPRLSAQELSSAYAQEFSSTLPVVCIRTQEKNVLADPDESVYPRRGEATCEILVFDSGDVNTLYDVPSETYTNTRVKLRGRSSSVQAKRPFAVEFHDEKGKTIDQPFLGFEAQSDFILHAPYIDKSGLRNYLAYSLAGELLEATPGCRLVEVFLSDGSGPLCEKDYIGIYLLVDKIKADSNTLTGFDRLRVQDPDEPQLETGGGYIIRRDKYDEGMDDVTVLPYTFQTYEYQVCFPKPGDLTEEEAIAIHHETQFFEDLVYYGTYEEMARYIDLDSFVYAIMINEFARNTEAFEGSAYFYRGWGEKFTAGPVWDFDISFGNNSMFPTGEGTTYTEKRLMLCYMEHPEFIARFAQAWRTLRQPGGTFNDEHLLALFDDAVARLGSALERNARRYPELFDGVTDVAGNARHFTSYTQELEYLRAFLLERAAWMDEYFAQF